MTFNCDACDFCEPRKSRCRKLESLPMVGEYAEAKTRPTWCPLTALESQLMTECGRLRAERDGLLTAARRVVDHWLAAGADWTPRQDALRAAVAACAPEVKP